MSFPIPNCSSTDKKDQTIDLEQEYGAEWWSVLCKDWISVDKDANWNQKGYVIRESLSWYHRDFIDVRTRRVLEGGFMIKLYHESRALRVDLLPQYKRSNCSPETIQMQVNYHENEESKIGNAQFKVSYCTCAILIISAATYLFLAKKNGQKNKKLAYGCWKRNACGS